MVDTERCIELVGVILRGVGGKDTDSPSHPLINPDYLRTPCARWWMNLVGLDPRNVWAHAVRGTSLQGSPYKPLTKCPDKMHR